MTSQGRCVVYGDEVSQDFKDLCSFELGLWSEVRDHLYNTTLKQPGAVSFHF